MNPTVAKENRQETQPPHSPPCRRPHPALTINPPQFPQRKRIAPVLAIIAATEYELAGLRRAMPPAPDVELQAVGIGRRAAQAAVKQLLTRPDDDTAANGRRRRQLLLVGLAGGLDPARRTGDLCLPFRYLRETQDGATDFLEPDETMYRQAIAALHSAAMDWHGGDSLTVAKITAAPADKAAQFRQYQAATVNMEDYWIARTAARYAVPFLAARAVLDTAGQALPPYLLQIADAGPGQIAREIAGHPRRLPALARLATDAARARQTLTHFALAFLQTPANGQDDNGQVSS